MMMQYLMIFLYVFLFGGIAGGIWLVLNKVIFEEKRAILHWFKAMTFFSFCNYFILSAVKWYLGSSESTLIESFWDVEIRTFLHYGIPLMVMTGVLPIFVKLVFKKVEWKLIQIFDFCMLVGLLLPLLCFGKISNAAYCVIFIICGSVAFLITCCYKKDFTYIERKEYRRYGIEAIPVIFAWIMIVGVYLPNELFLSNKDEFPGMYATFFLLMLLGSVIIGILFVLAGILFLPDNLYRIMCLVMAGIIIMGYAQYMFLNGELAAMDGEYQEWSVSIQAINIAIWLVIIILLAVVGYRKASIRKIVQVACVYVALIQVVSLGYLIITTDFDEEDHKAVMTTQGALDLAEENNVLIFVLDCFEGDWFETILEENQSFVDPLKDFTYYRNGTSQFAHTANAIQYMLTGTEWNESVENYPEYAYENSDALRTIAEQDYDIGIYTGASYISESVQDIVSNYGESVERSYDIGETLSMMTKTSMYKIAPFIIKPSYRYYTGDIPNMVKMEDAWNVDNDFPFYYSLKDEGLSIQEGCKNAFRFYHMRGPHGPFYLTEDLQYDPTGRDTTVYSQGRGSMKIVYEYLEQMKALGKYDDATIIITADHGQGYILNTEKTSGQPEKTSRPIFIIKEPNQHGEAMVINEAPVSQEELMPTIMKAVGIDWKEYGRTFDEIPEDEPRKRMYVDIYKNFIVQYEIDGVAWELDNWNIKSAVYN